MASGLNVTSQEIAENGTFKPIPSTGSKMIAHSSLVIMVCLAIFVGTFRSISCLQKKKDYGQKQDIISMQDAVIMPFYASFVLIGLYAFLKRYFSEEEITILRSLYISASGVLFLTDLLSPCVSKFIPENYLVDHLLVYTIGKDVQEEIIDVSFGTGDMIAFALCSIFGGVYLWNKHWIVNNIFIIAVAVKYVESFHLNSICIGCTLLGISFVSAVFCFFATDIMKTVENTEDPDRLLFPIDLFENGANSSNFIMAGLGDITLPGAFIALFLRFDESLQRGHKLYFYSSLLAYLLAIAMSYFKRGKPELFYYLPACIAIPSLVALINGDVNALLNYHDHLG